MSFTKLIKAFHKDEISTWVYFLFMLVSFIKFLDSGADFIGFIVNIVLFFIFMHFWMSKFDPTNLRKAYYDKE